MDEFALIRKYFSALTASREGVQLGVGDDCALLDVPPGYELAVTTDTLVSGRHFPERTPPEDIGWKSLAVSLSDLAAMGAQPRWFTLNLTLPEPDPKWLEGFALGLRELADMKGIALVGGDTTRGFLSVTITAMGVIPNGSALRRNQAKESDLVCVTGTLGDAALGLQLLRENNWEWHFQPPDFTPQDLTFRVGWRVLVNTNQPPTRLGRWSLDKADPHKSATPEQAFLYSRLNLPQPRGKAGRALVGLAHAAIDISDGLVSDLAHILDASGLGAEVFPHQLPKSPAFKRYAPPDQVLKLQLAGGDDYELCICLPESVLDEARARLGDLPLTVIGKVTRERGLRFLDANNQVMPLDLRGYNHFG